MSKDKIERSIFFYQMEFGARKPPPSKQEVAEALERINQLPFEENKRYYQTGDQKVLCAWIDRIKPEPFRLRLGAIRRSDLPQLEQSGQLSALNIPEDASLVEPMHVVVFPNNIVGAEFNFHGPRINRLASYLNARGGIVNANITIHPLVRRNVADDIKKFETLNVFRIKIRPSFASRVAEADKDLFSAFEAASKMGEADTIEVVLKRAKNTKAKTSLSKKLLKFALKMANAPETPEEAAKFVIGGVKPGQKSIDYVDVLSEYLVFKADVLKLSSKTKAVETMSAYAAIESAYAENETAIHEAAKLEGSG